MTAEIGELRARLQEAQETLHAIRAGEVDALVVSGPEGDNVFTLRTAEHPYRILVEAMNEGAATLSSEGIILYCNTSLAAMLEKPLEKIIGTSLSDYIVPSYLYAYDSLFKKGLNGSASGELILHNDTITWPAYVSCRSLNLEQTRALSLIITNITERKQAEEALKKAYQEMERRVEERTWELQQSKYELEKQNDELLSIQEKLRESELRCRIVADNTYDWEYWMSPNDTLNYVSPSCEQVSGRSPEAFMKNPSLFTAIVHPDDQEQFKAHLHERKIEKKRYALEYRIGHTDGTIRWIAHMCQPVFDGQGTFIGTRSSNRDITKRKETEKTLADHAARLEAINRELESFSFTASHDLRAPLRRIDGFVKLLFEDYAPVFDDQAKNYLERIRENAGNMGHLITALLSFARITRQDMRKSRVNLSAMATLAVEERKKTWPEREVTVVIPPKIMADGDPLLLQVVINNLIGNAWKFTKNRKDAIIEFGMTKNSETVYFIRDNGAGFNMEHKEKLFIPFQRFHSPTEFPGTGVGLATVQRIIHRHGGHIWAKGEENKGATFYFTLS